MSEENSSRTENSTDKANGSTHSSGSGETTSNVAEELRQQAEKFKNDFLYLRAEFDNYKRNVIKERSELLKYGSERLVTDILGVLDNFERALEAKVTGENLANYVKGVEMTAQELKQTLTKHGVTEVDSLGKPFDPNLHEALSSEESASIPAGHITRVFKKPYKLHDKLVRPGQVVVAKSTEGKN